MTLSNAAMVIEARDVRRVFGRGSSAQVALDSVDLSVAANEVVLLFGRSGSGKTTLLNAIGGLDREVTGRLEVFGKDILRSPERQVAHLRATEIGFVFQDFHLVEHLTVLENVATPNLFAPQPMSHKDEQERAREALTRVGLATRAQARPTQLSGGQRQRVAVARALYHRPRLLLCDEPTGNLDARTADELVGLLAELHGGGETTFVIATHEETLCALPHRRVDLSDGRVVSAADSVGAKAVSVPPPAQGRREPDENERGSLDDPSAPPTDANETQEDSCEHDH